MKASDIKIGEKYWIKNLGDIGPDFLPEPRFCVIRLGYPGEGGQFGFSTSPNIKEATTTWRWPVDVAPCLGEEASPSGVGAAKDGLPLLAFFAEEDSLVNWFKRQLKSYYDKASTEDGVKLTQKFNGEFGLIQFSKKAPKEAKSLLVKWSTHPWSGESPKDIFGINLPVQKTLDEWWAGLSEEEKQTIREERE